MSGEFAAKVDKHCQRGLHWRYVAKCLDLDTLCSDLKNQWPDVAVDEECWGKRRTIRVILPFRFEIRLGTALNCISFIHRFSASEDTREGDKHDFDQVLRAHVRALPG